MELYVPHYKEDDNGETLVEDRPKLPPEYYDEHMENKTNKALGALRQTQESWISNKGSKPYKAVYIDGHPHRQFIKADSHQMNDDYEQKNPPRYKYFTPNEAVVHANQAVDTAASIGIGTYNNDTFNETTFPDPTRMDLHGLRFYLTHNGKIIDKDTTLFIRKLFTLQQHLTLCSKKDQGILARIGKQSTLTAEVIGHKGILNRMLTASICAQGDIWIHMKVCPQQGRTCGQVVALYTAILLQCKNTDLGKSKHATLERIDNRDETVRAWVKLSIVKDQMAPLDWIDQLANMSNNTTAHKELRQLMQQQDENDTTEYIDMVAAESDEMKGNEPTDRVGDNNQNDPKRKGKSKRGKGKKRKQRNDDDIDTENQNPNKRIRAEPNFKANTNTRRNKDKGPRKRNTIKRKERNQQL